MIDIPEPRVQMLIMQRLGGLLLAYHLRVMVLDGLAGRLQARPLDYTNISTPTTPYFSSIDSRLGIVRKKVCIQPQIQANPPAKLKSRVVSMNNGAHKHH